MKRSKHFFSAFERCTFAVTMILVPVALGILVASAASADGDNEPRSLQFDLFNQRAFRTMIRNLHSYDDPVVAPDAEDGDSHAAAPAETVKPLTVEQLTHSQRDTLREQLRNGGCPTDVDPAYIALCESLLRFRSHPAAMRGLKNSREE